MYISGTYDFYRIYKLENTRLRRNEGVDIREPFPTVLRPKQPDDPP